MLETKTAGASLDQERAYGVAMIGVHEAMSRVRDALGPWDDPYKNFATNAPPFYWSISPGRITRWSYASLTPQANFALFSESSGTSLVNLNRPLADGSYPIIGQTNVGETSPPDVSVKWANVLRDPSQTAGSDNAIIGRYAFWVDDEGAKININTADGTEKYTTNSLGVGSPSEVSLEVLFADERKGSFEGNRPDGTDQRVSLSARNSQCDECHIRGLHQQRVLAHDIQSQPGSQRFRAAKDGSPSHHRRA